MVSEVLDDVIATEINQDLVAEFLSALPNEAPKVYMGADGILSITTASNDDYTYYQQQVIDVI